jgi:hypothetical protein
MQEIHGRSDDRNPDLFGGTLETALVPRYPAEPGFKEATTSREGALKIATDAKTLRANVLNVLHDVAPNCLSADQIAIRVSELKKAGQIVKCEIRTRNDSGLSASTWRAA